MKVDDRELLVVCLAMLMLVLLPTGLLLGSRSLAAAAFVLLVGAVARLVRLAARPDPWRAFDRELSDMGVVVADRPADRMGDGMADPADRAAPAGPHDAPAEHGRRITPRRR